MKRALILVVLGVIGWIAYRQLDLGAGPSTTIYRNYLHARGYRRPADARALAIGGGLDGIPEMADRDITRVDIEVLSDVPSADGRRHAVSSRTTVCMGSVCRRFTQSGTICKTDEGLKVCAFVENPVVEAPPR